MSPINDPCSRVLTLQQASAIVQDGLLDAQLNLASMHHDSKWEIEKDILDTSKQLDALTQQITQPVKDDLQSAQNQLRAAQQSAYTPFMNELAELAYELDRLERQLANDLPTTDDGDIDYVQIQDSLPKDSQDQTRNGVVTNPVQQATQAPVQTPQQPAYANLSPINPQPPGVQTPVASQPGPCPPQIVNVNCPPVAGTPQALAPTPGYPQAPSECNLWNPLAWVSNQCAQEFLDMVSASYGPRLESLMKASGAEAINAEFSKLMDSLVGR